jgi:hypothetical protein
MFDKHLKDLNHNANELRAILDTALPGRHIEQAACALHFALCSMGMAITKSENPELVRQDMDEIILEALNDSVDRAYATNKRTQN